MTDHSAPLCIELPGLLIDADATYAIDAEWDGRHLIGADATLLSARIDGTDVPRAKIVQALRVMLLDGEALVEAAEDGVVADWCETAEADAEDIEADEARDRRVA